MSKKLKVLLVIRWPVGGIRSFIRYVYPNFDPGRYVYTILAPDLPELKTLLDDLRGLDLTYIRIKPNPSIFDYFWVVLRTIIQGRYDIIHSHGFTAGSCTVLPSLVTRTPHIMTYHEMFRDGQFRGVNGFLKKETLSFLLRNIDIIHAVSEDAKNNLLTYIGGLKKQGDKIITIRNGIEVSQFIDAGKRDLRKELNLAEGTFLIGFLGRFMSPKGFAYLVDAIELMKKVDLPKKPLVLTFGYGGFVREENQEIKNRELEKYFIFLPFTTDIGSALKGLDVVAIPSIWEACPLVPMEAMVAGVPVIGTNCLGLRELLENTPASTIPVGDSTALANALVREIKNPSKSKASEFVEEAAKRFDVKRQATELEKVILNLVEERNDNRCLVRQK